jgi:hypothetical protein
MFEPMRLLTCILLLSQAALAADGPFVGKWTSTNNAAGGEIRISFEPQATLVFTFEGQEVTTKVTEARISAAADGAKQFTMVYRFTLGDTELTSQAKGVLKGDRIQGSYRTTANESDVDEGTFNGTLRK